MEISILVKPSGSIPVGPADVHMESKKESAKRRFLLKQEFVYSGFMLIYMN